ncbi:serine hydrolase domain-containing protein [Sphingomonas canadensis]|uniref:Serine hydrolase domain-containing protein n=1 Tax=Sphingomonas canadensis TaxID=1219257 RepID=A0ABW3H3I1_9SPHN|nr:serine hydrolase domain-containing protein [Sphingomonas canadensis]MCW3835590.1 beta-lactamase family protein [Sphingomonas canadensis]
MHRRLLSTAAILLLVPTTLPYAAAQQAAPASAPVRIAKARIDAALAAMVADGRAAGVSALIWKDGREAYFGTAGDADREAKRPMARDTLVQIFSMTKPVTGVALMQLWEQGRFGLDDPLSEYLPEFATMMVQDGVDASGSPRWRPASRPILIRDVMRHTAGFAYGAGPSLAETAFAEAKPLDLGHDLTEFGHRLARVPLVYDPGTRWHYSAAVDVQALLVERLSGMRFEEYVRRHILDPLGMRETGWTQPADRLPRLAAAYRKEPGGALVRKTDADIRAFNFDPARKLTMGGAGLASTLDDYMRFARMLLGGGSLDGVRILKPSTLRLMTTGQLDPRVTERQWLPGKGNGGFGLDFFVRTGQPKDAEENRGAVGEFFWDGAWSTLFWVDPANRLAAVFFVQSDPFDGTMHRDFRKAIYGADYLGPEGD